MENLTHSWPAEAETLLGDLVDLRRADEHRDMRVVPAGVHRAARLGGEVEPRVLDQGQCVHVAAQQHGAPVGGTAQNGDQSAGRRPLAKFERQPGEEGHHGARFMLDDGIIDPLPDAAFALHIMPNAPHGVFAGKPGPLLASSDVLSITVKGAGGHASMPHDAIDPIPVACAIVTAIQTMVTRRVSVFDPAVITIAKIAAGTTNNIIPETAEMLGTIRTLSPHRRAAVAAELRRLAPAIAEAHGCTAEVEIVEGFPVTVCDSRAAAFGQRVVEEVFGEAAWLTMDNPVMGAEDFAYVLEKVPGAMFWLGASHEGSDWRSCCGLHSNRMVLDEKVMARGAALHAALAERFFNEGFG